MAETHRGRLGVISGPSGSGKTSICKALASDPRVFFSVSATTRPKRPGEVDGRDYWFLPEEKFRAMADQGKFLEWALYNGRYYGTPREPVERALSEGKVVLLEIELQGATRLRRDGVEGVYIFLEPPSLEALEARLRRRGTESEEEIRKRLEIAREEWRQAREGKVYDYFVVNDDLARAEKEVRDLLGIPKEEGSREAREEGREEGKG